MVSMLALALALATGAPLPVDASAASRPYRIESRVLVDAARAQGGLAGTPQFSPDGRYLLFSRRAQTPSGGVDPGPEIWVARADGSTPRLLARSAFGASWSPHGMRLAFLRGRPSDPFGAHQLWTVRSDGSDAGVRADDVSCIWRSEFAWSPDGRHIAYLSSQPNRRSRFEKFYSLWTIDPDGARKRRHFTSRAILRFGWSADGERLCAWEELGAGGEAGGTRHPRTWVIDAGSGRHTQVRAPRRGAITGAAAFGPGGRHLSLVCYGPESDWHETIRARRPLISVWVKDLAAGRWRRIATRPGAEGVVRWSPGGDRLAAVVERVADCGCCVGYDFGIWRATGRCLRPLGDGAEVQWSPAGRRLFYYADYGEGYGIITACDSRGRRRTKVYAGLIGGCAWTPDGRSLAVVHVAKDGRASTIHLARLVP